MNNRLTVSIVVFVMTASFFITVQASGHLTDPFAISFYVIQGIIFFSSFSFGYFRVYWKLKQNFNNIRRSNNF